VGFTWRKSLKWRGKCAGRREGSSGDEASESADSLLFVDDKFVLLGGFLVFLTELMGSLVIS